MPNVYSNYSTENAIYVKTAKVSFIPHICHLDHPYIGGEILVLWRNFIFEYMTCVEEFLIFHTTDVEKS